MTDILSADPSRFINTVRASYEKDVNLCVRALFHLRELGLRSEFNQGLRTISLINHEVFVKCQEYALKRGYYGDLVTYQNPEVVKFIARQLVEDRNSLERGRGVSTCAKYAPTENKSRHALAERIIIEMNIDFKTYRKEYLTPLRQHQTRSVTELDDIPRYALHKFQHPPKYCKITIFVECVRYYTSRPTSPVESIENLWSVKRFSPIASTKIFIDPDIDHVFLATALILTRYSTYDALRELTLFAMVFDARTGIVVPIDLTVVLKKYIREKGPAYLVFFKHNIDMNIDWIHLTQRAKKYNSTLPQVIIVDVSHQTFPIYQETEYFSIFRGRPEDLFSYLNEGYTSFTAYYEKVFSKNALTVTEPKFCTIV